MNNKLKISRIGRHCVIIYAIIGSKIFPELNENCMFCYGNKDLKRNIWIYLND